MRYLRMIRCVLGESFSKKVQARGVLAAAVAVFALTAVLSAQEVATRPASSSTKPATPSQSQPAAGPAAMANPAPAADPSAPAAEENGAVRMVQPGTFDIHARDTDLRLMLQLLSTQGRKNIIATRDVAGKVSADLYSVTFKEALDAVLQTSGFVYEEKGNFVYVYSPEQLDKIKKAQRKMVVAAFRLTYITAADARTLLTPALSTEGSIAITPAASVGIAPSKSDTGGNSYAVDDVLVVRDYEDQMGKIQAIIRELDIKPQQVLIETTILQATLTEENALGVDFNVLAGINFESTGAVSGNPADTTINPNGTGAGESLTKGSLDAAGIDKSQPFGAVRTDFAGNVPKGGISFGFISNQVAAFVRALESVTPTTVLANPKLLVVNKQRGEVLIGRHDGYLTTTVTETVATQTVQFLDTGTRLIVRPYIGRDGYIRMEIHPEDSTGTVVQIGQSALPQSSTTEVTSNVMVRDGRTIIIGGLFREETKASRSQVPLAGNLPVLGSLFRSTADHTKRDEIIILVTPHIIKACDEAVGEQLKDDVERYRIGARKGLQWWGRDRLSQCFMRATRKDLSAGELDKAMWNLDSALSLNPQLAEGIQLKERLTGKAYWSGQARDTDVQSVIQQMIMQELGKPYETIVPPLKPLDASKIDPAVREALGIAPAPQPPSLYMPVGRVIMKTSPAMADQESTETPKAAPGSQPAE